MGQFNYLGQCPKCGSFKHTEFTCKGLEPFVDKPFVAHAGHELWCAFNDRSNTTGECDCKTR